MPLSAAMNFAKCPLCNLNSWVKGEDYGRLKLYGCANCGSYGISELALLKISYPREKAVLSHAIWSMKRHTDFPKLDRDAVEAIIRQNYLPDYSEQSDNLISFLGGNLSTLGRSGGMIDIFPVTARARIGCAEASDVSFLIDELMEANLLRYSGSNPKLFEVDVRGVRVSLDETYRGKRLGLTFKGWDRYNTIKRAPTAMHTAFMAMQYGDEELDELYYKAFKPACEDAGFQLKRLDEDRKAGIIDNHMRVEIRNARFLLADLTHGNRGAYWEAGFAEGLARPVIYLCKEEVFRNKEKQPHFDTNHCQTVLWRADDNESARKDLGDAIKATLPLEAKLRDE